MLKLCEQFANYSILKHDIKFSNMILGSANISFNRFQIFDV